jgi:hypothetical protein
MSNIREMLAKTATVSAIGVPVSNEVTNDGIITALALENFVWMGMTYGAWFKVISMISIIIVILVNVNQLCSSVSSLIKRIKKRKASKE